MGDTIGRRGLYGRAPERQRREGQGGKVLNIDWDIPAKGKLSQRLSCSVVTLVLLAGPLSALVHSTHG